MRTLVRSENKMLLVSWILAVVPILFLFMLFSKPLPSGWVIPLAFFFLALGGVAGSLAGIRSVYLALVNNRSFALVLRLMVCLPVLLAAAVYVYAMLIFMTWV